MLPLKEELVLLSEGDADKEFLRAIITTKGSFPGFDFPFPNKRFHGRNAFGQMLHALRGDPTGFAKLKGVLIVGDSANDPAATFNDIADQIKNASGFSVPPKPLQIGPATADHPAIAVMLLPNETTPGSLESLYLEELITRNKWLKGCLDQFLSCGQSQASTWSPEKLAKAKFASAVAAIHEEDPSRAASKVFRSPSVIDITADCYRSVEDRIRTFCANVVVP